MCTQLKMTIGIHGVTVMTKMSAIFGTSEGTDICALVMSYEMYIYRPV